MKTKLIVYDSNCKICTGLKDWVTRFTPVPGSKVIAFKDLPEKYIGSVDPQKFKNAMALIDTEGAPTIYGTDGIAYIFSSYNKAVKWILQWPLIFRIFEILYKILSSNRYIIATPRSWFACDCYPDKIIRYRVAYIVSAVSVAVILTLLLGASLAHFFTGLSAMEAAGQMLLIAGTGWVIQLIVSFFLLKEKWLDYAGHLSTIMVAGLLVTVPWIVAGLVWQISFIWLPLLSVVFSSSIMLYLHIQRVRYLQISWLYTLSWFVFLQTTAFAWMYIFHFNS